MRVVIKEPGRKPVEQQVPNTLESLQHIVGGYIETVTLNENSVLLVNEEGMIMNLPYNCTFIYPSAKMPFKTFGTIVLVGYDGDEFVDAQETLESHGPGECRCYLTKREGK